MEKTFEFKKSQFITVVIDGYNEVKKYAEHLIDYKFTPSGFAILRDFTLTIRVGPKLPSPGRSAVNERLKKIWGHHDKGLILAPEDIEYIRDYYQTQSNYWNSQK